MATSSSDKVNIRRVKKKADILVIERGVELIRQLKRICSAGRFSIMGAQTIEHVSKNSRNAKSTS